MTGQRGPIRGALERSLRVRDREHRDRAVWALACQYADLIDQAEALAAVARELLDPEGGLDAEDVDGRRRLAALARAVDAQNVASDLGPKLIDALHRLHLTTAARMQAAKGAPTDAPDPAATALERLRATRPGPGINDTPPVDPATP